MQSLRPARRVAELLPFAGAMKRVLAIGFSLLSLLCFRFTADTTTIHHMRNEHPYILGLGGVFWVSAGFVFASAGVGLMASFLRARPLRRLDVLWLVVSGLCCTPPLVLFIGFITAYR